VLRRSWQRRNLRDPDYLSSGCPSGRQGEPFNDNMEEVRVHIGPPTRPNSDHVSNRQCLLTEPAGRFSDSNICRVLQTDLADKTFSGAA
jgi:hypothetical protein